MSRLTALKWAGVALFVLLIARVGYLKVARAETYAPIVDGANLLTNRPDPPEPGMILDAALRRIAYSDRDYLVAIEPDKFEVRAKTSNEPDAPAKATPDQAAQEIADIIGIPASVVQGALKEKRRWQPVATHVPPRAITSLKGLCKDLKLAGVAWEQTFVRHYPFGKIGCYVAGRRRADHTPVSGLELNYRFLLDGIPGTPRTNVDPYGRLIVGQEDTPVLPAIPGKNLVLSIDMDLQQTVDAALDECMKINQPATATCTVFDVRTGEIKALGSRPDCDPNAVAIPAADASSAVKSTPVKPAKATPKPSQEAPKAPEHDDHAALPALRPFEPGSTFKILTAACAIECGVADEHTTYRCNGREMVGGKPLKCAWPYDSSGHGDLDLPGMLAKSCNLFAAHLAVKIGPERLVAFLRNCGIGEPARSGFPFEPPGILHSAAALRTPDGKVRTRDIANMGFGQNVAVTDIQLLAATSAVLDGGILVQPHIVSRILDSTGGVFRTVDQQSLRRVCSESTSKRMRKMLRFAVETGTGKPARIPGVAVGGKTGTAQKWVMKDLDPSHPDPKTRVPVLDGFVMSFLLFLPVDQCPRYAILVTADDPKQGEHGSDVAAPVARKVAVELCRSTGMLTPEQLAKLNSAASPR